MRTPAAVYRTHPDRQRPPDWLRARARPQPSLTQFVVLSMALHALFISLFGAPTGGSREGRAMWGALDVMLVAPRLSPAPSLKLDRGMGRDPGIAREAGAPVAKDSTAPPRPVAAPAAPLPSPVHLSPTKDITPPRVAPEGPVEAPAEQPAPPPEPRAEPLPVQPLFVPPQPIEKVTAPEIRTEILPSLQLPPLAEPALPASTPPPAAPPPQVERPMAPRVEVAPAEAPPVPAPLVQPVVPAPPAEQLPTPPVERQPMQVPVVPVPPIESPVPPKVEPAPSEPEVVTPRAQPIAPPAPTPAPEAPAAPAAPAAPPAAERVEPPAPDREAAPRTEPATRAPAPGPRDTPSDIFRTPRDAPGATRDPSSPSGIDLDAARRRARELAREGSGNRALLPFPMPVAPPHKTREEIALEKARKPDCKTAYQDLGLLAVVPLVANEFGEGTCRW